jgi:hypothetical protein
MKKFTMFAIILASTNVFAVNFEDIAGKYLITSEYLQTQNYITLTKDGHVTLIESSEDGEFQCSGEATLTGTVLESKVTCEDGGGFFQSVDFVGVTSYENFTASVYSSLFGESIPMDFKKINESVLSVQNLIGTYEVTPVLEGIQISNIITLTKDLKVTLVEKSPYGEFNCSGNATIIGTIVESKVTCENGAEFTQKVNFKNVTNFDNFSAPVYSSLYDEEMPMNFKRK